MKQEALKKALELAARLGHVVVATADADGLPHISAAGRIELRPEGDLAVSAWFCPGTLANAQVNPRVSLVVWEPESDLGYQILGEIEDLQDLSMLNGYSPDLGRKGQIPQVERQLIIHANKVISFRHAPHSDLEE